MEVLQLTQKGLLRTYMKSLWENRSNIKGLTSYNVQDKALNKTQSFRNFSFLCSFHDMFRKSRFHHQVTYYLYTYV
jgi:hypothetical protein